MCYASILGNNLPSQSCKGPWRHMTHYLLCTCRPGLYKLSMSLSVTLDSKTHVTVFDQWWVKSSWNFLRVCSWVVTLSMAQIFYLSLRFFFFFFFADTKFMCLTWEVKQTKTSEFGAEEDLLQGQPKRTGGSCSKKKHQTPHFLNFIYSLIEG